MTDSPSDAPETEDQAAADPSADLAEWTADLAEAVGAASWSADHRTAQIRVEREHWSAAVDAARNRGLEFFSWLSAIDWSREVTVGEAVEDADELEERYDVICRLSSVGGAESVILVASVPKDDPVIDSIVSVFGGAAWHEREAAEMFGLDFAGHPNLVKIYLPSDFEGYPLRKSFPLLAREVKPWPGTVDVEGMPDDGPSTENTEAAATGGGAR